MPKRKSTEVGKSPSSATKRQKTASSVETKSKKKSPRKITTPRKSASINTTSPKEVVKKKASPKKSASTRKTSSKAAIGKKTSAKTDDDDDEDNNDETDGKVSSSKQKKTYPKLVDPATNKETVKKDLIKNNLETTRNNNIMTICIFFYLWSMYMYVEDVGK